MNTDSLERDLKQKFPDVPLKIFQERRAAVIEAPAAALPALLEHLKANHAFDFLMNISGADWLDHPDYSGKNESDASVSGVSVSGGGRKGGSGAGGSVGGSSVGGSVGGSGKGGGAPSGEKGRAASSAAGSNAPADPQTRPAAALPAPPAAAGSPLEKRFAVVYELFAGKTIQRLRIKISVNEGEEIPTAQFIYRTADWFEREIYDMFGLRFQNHPNLKRILTHHQFKGWPLRKDYPADRQQHLTETLPFQMEREPDGKLPDDSGKDLIPLNIGPSHPATHGTLRIMALMDGEKIHRANVEIGYLHRCFEKMAETHPYNQVIPYTDRLNYCSSAMNNVGYCKAVEDLMEIEIPPKAQAMRIILCELSRIIDHIVCIGAAAFDLGALSGFFHLFTYREKVYTIFEKLCGARLTVSMTRIGGMADKPPPGWFKDILQFCREMRQGVEELDTLLTNNKIWVQRNEGVGAIDVARAVQWGYTGPCLRAAGLNLDLRKADPYYGYDGLDFEVPVGSTGDAYDRYLVRVEEMRQSLRIIEQVCRNVPPGDHCLRDRDIVLPEKKEVYGNIEGLMNHFMLIIHGLRPPKGEIYSATEAANGELGFYLISDGGAKPYRLKVRPPCFAVYQSFPHEVRGGLTADAVTLLGSMNIIAGELDR